MLTLYIPTSEQARVKVNESGLIDRMKRLITLFFISSIFIYSNVQNECFVLELLEQTEQKKIFVYI